MLSINAHVGPGPSTEPVVPPTPMPRPHRAAPQPVHSSGGPPARASTPAEQARERPGLICALQRDVMGETSIKRRGYRSSAQHPAPRGYQRCSKQQARRPPEHSDGAAVECCHRDREQVCLTGRPEMISHSTRDSSCLCRRPAALSMLCRLEPDTRRLQHCGDIVGLLPGTG